MASSSMHIFYKYTTLLAINIVIVHNNPIKFCKKIICRILLKFLLKSYILYTEVIAMSVITDSQKFITINNLKDMGFSYYKISQLEREGLLCRVNRSTYENLTYKGEENDFYCAEAFVPNGVICLMSAARYYELTNFLPDAIEVAIERKKKVSTLPNWPEIRIFYFAPARMDIGVKEIHEAENTFHIFDIEKTVVDIIYYRNKIGVGEAAEILKNYLKRRERQIDRLYAYAKQLRCEEIIRTYLEVLL